MNNSERRRGERRRSIDARADAITELRRARRRLSHSTRYQIYAQQIDRVIADLEDITLVEEKRRTERRDISQPRIRCA